MRIIAGTFRGRKLLPPESSTTRPITDRAKQSVFDIIAGDLPGASVYDCFAGTGSMGLESLSREARSATFFEADRSALQRLRQNIAALDVEKRCRIVAGDLFKWFARMVPPDQRADVIFLDPPYRFVRERPDQLRLLVSQMIQFHLAEDGYILFRHDAGDSLSFSDVKVFDRREYGGMGVEFLRPQP